MLKTTTVDKIAKLLRIDAKKLTDALAATEETEVEIADDLQVFTAADITARDKNKYQEGKTAEREIAVKNLKRKHELDITADEIDTVVEAVVSKATKSATPDKRVTELETSLSEAKTKLKELATERDALRAAKTTLETDTRLLGLFPKERIPTIKDNEFLQLVKSSIAIEVRDGKEVVVKNGVAQLKPDSLDPIPVEEVVSGYFKERSWISAEGGGGDGGRGGTGSGGAAGAGKFTKMSEVRAAADKQGINIMGEKGAAFVQAAIKENPGLDLNA